jgi:uncharacterized protein YcfJ
MGAMGITALAFATTAAAQITFYENEGFRGRAFSTDKPVSNFERFGFNDRASSVVVEHGRWEVCEDARFSGRCTVLRPGSYDSLRGLGMENKISSVRMVEDRRTYVNEAPAPLAAPTYDYRRRPDERTYEAPVTSTRAVVGSNPEQRCWVEREQVSNGGRGDPNVGGAVVGAILGGVLGHQIGNGRGNDVATAGGAIAGGVIGSNVGRDGGGTSVRDVRKCENVSGGTPAYWDVTYNFRGQEHRVQLASPPGATIVVNEQGEPRG